MPEVVHTNENVCELYRSDRLEPEQIFAITACWSDRQHSQARLPQCIVPRLETVGKPHRGQLLQSVSANARDSAVHHQSPACVL
jgi:hypothetical protein